MRQSTDAGHSNLQNHPGFPPTHFRKLLRIDYAKPYRALWRNSFMVSIKLVFRGILSFRFRWAPFGPQNLDGFPTRDVDEDLI